MIQRMNNVLVKHSKVLFGVITILIIISFVWFLTPGADGSLLFSRNSNKAGEVFGKTVTIDDMEKARDNIVLAQIPMYLAQGANAGMLRELAGSVDELTMFQFAAFSKAAVTQGIAASDAEVKKAIAVFPAFQTDGKFSQAAYDAFKDTCLTPAGYTFEDFENAIRAMIVFNKFQARAVSGLTVTDDEVERVAKAAAQKTTIREMTFSAADYKKSLPAVTDVEIKAAYDAAPENYMSEPLSDALLVYVNVNDVKAQAVDAKQVDEQYKAFGSMMTGKDGKPMPEAEAKAQIRTELEKQMRRAAAESSINKFYLSAVELVKTEEFTPALLKKQAEAAGLKVAAVSKLTAQSPEDVTVSKNMIAAICALKDVNTMTYPVPNKDSVAFALLTARTQPKQLTFDEAKGKIGTQLADQKAAEKAMESARALRGDITAGTVTADKLDAAVAKLGGKIDPAKDFIKLAQVAGAYAQAKAMQEANPNVGGMMNFLKATLMQPDFDKGFVSEAAPTANGVYTMFYIADVVPAPEVITDEAKAAVRELILLSKQEQAVQEWAKWLEANTKCYLQLDQQNRR